MNKLNTLRDEKAEELYEKLSKGEEDLSEIGIFNKGWDAHEALNLPVLFGIFYSEKCNRVNNAYHTYAGKTYTMIQLYDYWINNIYTP